MSHILTVVVGEDEQGRPAINFFLSEGLEPEQAQGALRAVGARLQELVIEARAREMAAVLARAPSPQPSPQGEGEEPSP